LFQLFIAIPVKIYLFILKAIDKIWSWLKAGVKLFIKLITIIGQLLKLLFLNPLALLTNPLQSLKSIGNSGGEIVDNLSEGLEKVTDNLSEGIEEVTDNLSEGIEEVTDNLS
ncbi:hypothetical protein, partial [Dapis sp. BLCC M229]|uniref:hypothetical protein n=1 Tax=Dapis sp. BLCC M229 TaxID=3400188 RepID=UPI003CF9A6BC